MEINNELPRHDLSKRVVIKIILISLLVTLTVGGILYYLTSVYILSQAEKNIQNLLLSHRGIHEYVQKVMHPALYDFKDNHRIPHEFYSPELFSSSFMVRNQHIYYNQARIEIGLSSVYYKMAANNPRNPVNKADAIEAKLINMFNQDRELKKYRDIIEIEGKTYLYVAMPFAENQPRCMVCHGKRESSPIQLQEIYAGLGGFNEQLGEIRAIESIRAPMDSEYLTVYIISASLVTGFIAILGLTLFNRRMKTLVVDRTKDLKSEIRERVLAEQQVHELNTSLEKRVKERTIQLEAANQELDSFAYSVSHDLRAPLRGIDGFSLALLEDYQDQLDENGKDYINRVRAGCTRMSSLIDDLLKMSRMTRCEMNREDIDLSKLVLATFENLIQLDPKREVLVEVAPKIIVNADPVLIQAVVDNLVGNAWKFTGKTETAKIEFSKIFENNQPVYYIKDNGAGFSMSYANKLFGAFQRLHSPSEFEGTGIGLATVQRIIHRHGGTIRAEGAVDQGAIFYFTL